MSWLKRLFSIVSEQKKIEEPREQLLDAPNKSTSKAMKTSVPKSQAKPRKTNRNLDSTDIHAMRMARIEAEQVDAKRLGIQHLYMHISALSPTTRPTHAARHGLLYTEEEIQEWWASDGNDVGCKCTTVMILVDEDGNPMTPSIIERARKTYEDMKAKGNGEWTKS